MKTPEDEEFERLLAMQDKKTCACGRAKETEQCPVCSMNALMAKVRNDTLEEVAQKFDRLPFGDTSQSFAIFVREMKK